MAKIQDLKLVIYSGGQLAINRRLHQSLSELVGPQKRKSFTYIPFCFDQHQYYYKRAIRRYKAHGFTDFHCLPVDRPIDNEGLKKALNSDVIYLAGGNTFYFLSHLKRSGFIHALKEYSSTGGVLAGLSAGGIIMTPHIELAGYPNFECDENEVGLTQLSGLNLLNMEFFPHYISGRRIDTALKKYSRKSKYPVYACQDGGGMVINGTQKTYFGKSFIFINGHRLSL